MCSSDLWNIAQTVTVSGVDDLVYDGNKAYTVVLAAAGSGDAAYNGLNPNDLAVTNVDNEPPPPTKFFVVNDGAPDRTYEYDAAGTAIENYTIATANSAPRGVVSATDGKTIWVVDKNRNVYVYDDAGVLQGSWTAGTLGSGATVEGIATDGTHIWIVDSKSDKVFYYADAALRRSGTQAAASFALGSGNTNPKDLVYGKDASNNGYLWVVNDATTDRVFRYSVNSGTGAIALLNSWNLNANNKSPTGITLDPGATSGDLWVVDNGTTKQVFKYTGGRDITGSTAPVSAALFPQIGRAHV